MSKGERTRRSVVDNAIRLASMTGLEALTIGGLAGATGMSKSGLFAHFRSKENLQIHVIEGIAERFIETIVQPAIAEPRGLPRLRALFTRWVRWSSGPQLPGGCPLVTAAVEFDDRPGLVRDLLARHQKNWIAALARAVQISTDEGHLQQGTDPEQFAFTMQGILLSLHYHQRLLKDAKALNRAEAAFEDLIKQAQA